MVSRSFSLLPASRLASGESGRNVMKSPVQAIFGWLAGRLHNNNKDDLEKEEEEGKQWTVDAHYFAFAVMDIHIGSRLMKVNKFYCAGFGDCDSVEICFCLKYFLQIEMFEFAHFLKSF
jgi:hypothetical protein